MVSQTWAASSQLPHGGWHWSPGMNTSLIKANEAFLRFCCWCRGKQWGAPPPTHPQAHSWTPGRYRVNPDTSEKDTEKGRKTIYLASCISHRQTVTFHCFVMERKRQEPRAIKQLWACANSGLAINLSINKQGAFGLTTGTYLRRFISAALNSKGPPWFWT